MEHKLESVKDLEGGWLNKSMYVIINFIIFFFLKREGEGGWGFKFNFQN